MVGKKRVMGEGTKTDTLKKADVSQKTSNNIKVQLIFDSRRCPVFSYCQGLYTVAAFAA